MYGNDYNCDLCRKRGENNIETQEHILRCHTLSALVSTDPDVMYKHIFGNTHQQKKVVLLYSALLVARERLLGEDTCLPGHKIPDPVP